ncbi:hypothetical protein B0H13DRAFT_2362514 [Mycena leptocephala]|nr:hypothetical protein B0H13DRAFT_2362514 [Mycena leptocephala]
MGAISLQKGQSSSDHDRHRLSVTLISLSPSFVRHASTAAMLRRFSAHARFHATALSPPSPLFRASTCNDPRHSYVASFSCGRRLSVAPLDLHVEIILIPPSFMMTFIPSNGPRFGASTTRWFRLWTLLLDHQLPSLPYAAALRIIKSVDHQGVLPPLFSSSSPLPSLPPAFLPQVQVCVNANDAFVGQIAGPEERTRIVDAICARGGEMMMHQCVLILSASSLRYVDHPPALCWNAVRLARACGIVDLATNCYGYYVIQKALECKEEEDCLLIVSELLRGDPALTLVGKHVSHAWSKITGLSWTSTGAADLRVVPPPPLFIDADSNPAMILIASVLLTADKNQRAALYDCIRVHIVTLRGCKTVSKVIWLFDRMRAYCVF